MPSVTELAASDAGGIQATPAQTLLLTGADLQQETQVCYLPLGGGNHILSSSFSCVITGSGMMSASHSRKEQRRQGKR